MFPPQPFASAIVARGVLLWAVLRLVVWFLSAVTGGGTSLSGGAVLLLVLVAAVAAFLDTQRRNEVLFLANLGVGSIPIALLAGGPALLLELLIAFVRHL
jgi:hypothetical protein